MSDRQISADLRCRMDCRRCRQMRQQIKRGVSHEMLILSDFSIVSGIELEKKDFLICIFHFAIIYY